MSLLVYKAEEDALEQRNVEDAANILVQANHNSS